MQNIATGCTIVFNKNAKELFLSYLPQNIVMHDYWMYLLCVFFGEVIYDPIPHLGYRQHLNNVLGDNSSGFSKFKSRCLSFKTIKNQHFREEMASELFNGFKDRLSYKDAKKVKEIMLYRKKLILRINLLFDSDIYMLTFDRNIWLKIRILLGKL